MKLGRIKYKVKHIHNPREHTQPQKKMIDFHHPVSEPNLDQDSDYSICDIHSSRQNTLRDEANEDVQSNA